MPKFGRTLSPVIWNIFDALGRVMPGFDELDSSKLGTRDRAPAAKRGFLSVIGYDH